MCSSKVDEIPLKASQETFVDDPTTLEDVNIDEILHDLSNGTKDINKLHILHSVKILSITLQDIIMLQQDRELLNEFRKQQLAKYDIILEDSHDGRNNNLFQRKTDVCSESGSSSSSPDFILSKTIDDDQQKDELMRANTPVSLTLDDVDEIDAVVAIQERELHYIPIKILVENLSFDKPKDPITFHSCKRMRAEYNYSKNFKLTNQSLHLLKAFNLIQVPSITLEQYLVRINTYSPSISISCYVHAAYLMFKLSILFDIVPLSYLNVYRFILGSIRCSTKKLEDIHQKQKAFATVGGISDKNLFKIEVGFLYLCNFNLVVGEDIMNFYLKTHLIELREFCKTHFENNNDDNI